MAIASQAKLFCDISKSTKTNASNINDEDFNMVAYLLSTQTINGKKNNNYANSDPNLQFYPAEAGSCWWRRKKNADGTEQPPEVKVQALLTYKLADGTIRQIPLHDLKGTGAAQCTERGALVQQVLSIFGTESYYCMECVDLGDRQEGHCFNIVKRKNDYALLDYSVPIVSYKEDGSVNLLGGK